jgi:ABC-type cobalamin/Fe3+-siderophores transport system ATPase subunit
VAVWDLTFQALRGQVLGIIGPNGAGKTTLLRAILGLHRPHAGMLRVLGRDPSRLRAAQLAAFRTHVGYVPQLDFARSGVPLTVREVIEISRAGRAGLLRGLRPADREAVRLWLERLGLGALASRPYEELSGGQQRKVQLARALAQEPSLLLMDEPAANLDLAWQQALLDLIEQVVTATHVTLLLVTHDVSLLPACCDAVLVLAGGRRRAFGPPGEVLTPGIISELYGLPVDVERRAGRFHLISRGSGDARL